MKNIKIVWNKWKNIAEKIGIFQMKLVFSVLYFLIITPVGLIYSLFKDPLERKSFPSWKDWNSNSGKIDDLRDQF